MAHEITTLLKIKVFMRLLRVFIMSLRENFFVVFNKTFSQKPSQNHWYESFFFDKKNLMEVFFMKSF